MPALLALHVGEEWLGDFPRYAHEVLHGAPMSRGGLLQSNAVFLITLMGLGWWAARRRTQLSAFLLLVWGSGHLFWNFVFHLWTTAATGQFSPGLVTGALLFYPAVPLVALAAIRQNRITFGATLLAFILGGAIMALIVWAGVYRFAGIAI